MKTARLVASLLALTGCATTGSSDKSMDCLRPCSEKTKDVGAYRACVDECLGCKPRRPKIETHVDAGAKGNLSGGARVSLSAPLLPAVTKASEAPVSPDDVEFLETHTEAYIGIKWADFRVQRDRFYRLFTHPNGQCPIGNIENCFRLEEISRSDTIKEYGGSFNHLEVLRKFANEHQSSPRGEWVMPEAGDVPDLQAVCTHPKVSGARVCYSIWIGKKTFTKPGEIFGSLSMVAFPMNRKNPMGERVTDSMAGVAFKWKPGKGRRR